MIDPISYDFIKFILPLLSNPTNDNIFIVLFIILRFNKACEYPTFRYEAALVSALINKLIQGAGFDVFENEPHAELPEAQKELEIARADFFKRNT